MIDKAGQIGQQYSLPGDFSIPRNPAESHTEVPKDSFKTSGSSSREHCIIIPPRQIQERSKENAIYKVDDNGGLNKFDVNVEKKLDVIGGYVATLDDSQKKELKDAGYQVFKDEVRQWLPSKPDPFGGLSNDEGIIADGSDKITEEEIMNALKLEERPKMTEARFDSPLTREYNGKGVTIAVIDTGIYPHPDFTYPENRIKCFVDLVNGKSIPYDDNGHGTHVAGDAAGNGVSSEGGIHKGLATGSDIVAIKALAGNGSGSLSAIIGGIQFCIQNKEALGIDIINMSLGHSASENYWEDPVNMAVRAAFDAGILVVAAAGNEGPDPGTVGTPGDNPFALSVGAYDDNNTKDPSDDKLTDFSSRGPTTGGLMKPDVVAPGEAIIAPVSPGTDSEATAVGMTALHDRMKWYSTMPDDVLMTIPRGDLERIGLPDEAIENWYQHPLMARMVISKVFDNTKSMPIIEGHAHQGMPGTSMAAPITSGMAASIKSANRNLSPGQMMEIIKKTANKLPGEVPEAEQGKGGIDPDEAIQMALDAKDGKITIAEPNITWPGDVVQLELPFPEERGEENIIIVRSGEQEQADKAK